VQWHPERTDDEKLGQGLFNHLVQQCLEGRVAIR
jgi:gamma-glutamyl-gamma-aminobutyrate hydrolase PuuD